MLQIKNTLGGGKPEGLYAWKKLSAQGGDFIDYVVSDKETAYPDGAEQGGYYYEKVLDISNLGYTKVATGSFTPSSNVRTITVTHNLGVVPRYVIVKKKSGNYTSSHVDGLLGYVNSSGKLKNYILFGSSEPFSSDEYVSNLSIGASTMSLNGYTEYFTKGEEYSFMVLA